MKLLLHHKNIDTKIKNDKGDTPFTCAVLKEYNAPVRSAVHREYEEIAALLYDYNKKEFGYFS